MNTEMIKREEQNIIEYFKTTEYTDDLCEQKVIQSMDLMSELEDIPQIVGTAMFYGIKKAVTGETG